MREAWSDDRLDDLNRKVEEGFKRVDNDIHALRIETKTEIRELRAEMNGRFEKVDGRFDKVDKRFERLDARFDSLQRTLIIGVLALSSAFVAGFAALIGLFATQL